MTSSVSLTSLTDSWIDTERSKRTWSDALAGSCRSKVGSSVFTFLIAPDSSRVAYLANPSGPVAQELFAAPIAGELMARYLKGSR